MFPIITNNTITSRKTPGFKNQTKTNAKTAELTTTKLPPNRWT